LLSPHGSVCRFRVAQGGRGTLGKNSSWMNRSTTPLDLVMRRAEFRWSQKMNSTAEQHRETCARRFILHSILITVSSPSIPFSWIFQQNPDRYVQGECVSDIRWVSSETATPGVTAFISPYGNPRSSPPPRRCSLSPFGLQYGPYDPPSPPVLSFLPERVAPHLLHRGEVVRR